MNVLEKACAKMRQQARCTLLKKELEIQWSRRRCQQRNETIKEDLIATFWHPSRVKEMLRLGGWELVEIY